MIKTFLGSKFSSLFRPRLGILLRLPGAIGQQQHAVVSLASELTTVDLQHLEGINAVGYKVRLIWPNPWNTTKLLFFFIRYFPVILQITIMFLGTPPFTFSHHDCYIWNVYQALATTLVIACVDYILILRVFALYPRNRVVHYILFSMYIVELGTISVCMGLSVPGLGYDETCTVVSAPLPFLIAAGAPIAYQTLLFVLTGWKFFEAVKSGWGHIPIMKLLMRDGTWAFMILFVILVSEALLYTLATEAYSGVLYGWLNTMFSFCGYRILLNLHELNVSQSRRTSALGASRTRDVVQFSTHFEFSPPSESYELYSNASAATGSRSRGEDEVMEGGPTGSRRRGNSLSYDHGRSSRSS
ncbi:hypothetical protein DFP72DRAFT_203941 [Ephemerocybe angulata]|uniref:DUF6533 domain-containing protein n=1 Tax=Ephemerocybe angulata TaxID=980116 RepID=A0A8H6IK75_9AGAR|nr:hypothetical protein DFP72DRAFT_203941 [Tulosesus angulatus]